MFMYDWHSFDCIWAFMAEFKSNQTFPNFILHQFLFIKIFADAIILRYLYDVCVLCIVSNCILKDDFSIEIGFR